MPRAVPARLAVMMFFHYGVMGAWIVTLVQYLLAPPGVGLAFTPSAVSWVYSSLAVGGLVAPTFVGILADRLFAAERVMAVTATLSAVLIAGAGGWCQLRERAIAEAFENAAAGRALPDGRPLLPLWNDLRAAEATAPADPRTAALRTALAGPVADAAADPGVRAAAADTFGPLFGLMLGYAVCILTNSTLANVLTMRNLPDPARDFGKVRLWGTVGWIAAGFAVGPLMRPPSAGPLFLAAAGAAFQGLYAFTLPHTPPKGRTSPLLEVVGLPALTLFRQLSFGVFVGCLFVATVMQQWYGVFAPPFLSDAGVVPAAAWMTVAQVVEVGCMFYLPWLRDRLGIKGVMLLGLLGWAGRNAAFVWGGWWAAVLIGLPLHGVSYTFFTVMGALYVDRLAPRHLRAGAQGLITLVSLGPGMMLGNWLSARIVEHNRAAGGAVDWPSVWVVPLAGCGVAVVVFAALFRPPPEGGPKQDYPEPEELPTGTSGVAP